MSAGGVNNSDTIRCDSVFQKIIRRLIIWLCCTVAVFFIDEARSITPPPPILTNVTIKMVFKASVMEN